jgi:hypothetical protein
LVLSIDFFESQQFKVSRTMVKRKLAEEPACVDGRWVVQLVEGHELYACAIDACRASQVAAAEAALSTQVRLLLSQWAGEIAAVCGSTDHRFGRMAVSLSPMPKACLPLLTELAISKSN